MKNKIKLFGLALVALFLVLSIRNYSGAGINDVKQSLKKGKVKTEDTKTNSTNVKTAPTQSKVKQNIKRIDLPPNYNGKKEDFFKNFYKPLKEIKIGGKKISVRPSSNKTTTKTNMKVSGPQRIQDTVKKINKGEAAFAIPDPAKEFGFSETQEDKIRVQGEAEVTKLYEKATSIVWGSAENPKILKEMHDLAYDVIFKKYSRYPDLCAIARLYLIDATARFYLNPAYPLKEYSNGTFGGKDNNYYKRYLQIVNDYIHEKKDVNISKIFDIIVKQRMNIIWENDTSAVATITEDQSKIQTGLENLNEIINESAYYPDAEKAYIRAVVDEMSLILSYYRDMYYWSIMTGDYQTAHSIFNYEVENGKIKFTGTFMDVYRSIPKQVIFHYVSGYDEQGDPIIKDKMVDLYKEASQFLSMVELFRASETKVNEQEFDEKDKNLTQAKIEASCDWLNTFKPDAGDDINPPEVISATDLETFHNNAYGENDYYKNKPVIIKRMYFTRVENTKLTYEDIPNVSDRITIRCEIDSTQPIGPYYDMKIVLHSDISNRYKSLTMKQDYELHGFYEKFRPNETNDPTDETNNLIDIDTRQANPEPIPHYPDENEPQPPLPPPTYPTIPISIVASKTIKKSNVRSISVAQCEKGGPQSALKVPPSLYIDNEYFNKTLVRSYLVQDTEDVKNKVCPNSKAFLMSGGGEFIQAGKKDPNDQFIGISEILVKRVANWFVIQGHGSDKIANDSIGTKDDSAAISPLPDLLVTSNDENNNIIEISRYSGMDVLIIDACFVFKHNRYKNWRKVLPKGLIIGYHDEVGFEWMDQALDKVKEELKNSSITQEQLGKAWAKINRVIYNKFSYIQQILFSGPWSYGYILPKQGDPNKSIYRSGGTRLDDGGWKSVSIPNQDKEF